MVKLPSKLGFGYNLISSEMVAMAVAQVELTQNVSVVRQAPAVV
jgi:hypothetical protein